jgi:hypothetical protein
VARTPTIEKKESYLLLCYYFDGIATGKNLWKFFAAAAAAPAAAAAAEEEEEDHFHPWLAIPIEPKLKRDSWLTCHLNKSFSPSTAGGGGFFFFFFFCWLQVMHALWSESHDIWENY